MPVKEAILDGEVVALDSEGRESFRDLTAGRGNLHYAAFDALWIEGKDLRPLLLTRRKQMLISSFPPRRRCFLRCSRSGSAAGIYSPPLSGSTSRGSRRSERPIPTHRGVTWYKIKNRAYTQLEGRAELFHPR